MRSGEGASSIAKDLIDSEDPKHTLFCRDTIIYIKAFYIFVAKTRNYDIFVAKMCNYDIFVAKTRNYDILSRKFMITRSSIAFVDFLGSSIAPQVMPPCHQHILFSGKQFFSSDYVEKAGETFLVSLAV